MSWTEITQHQDFPLWVLIAGLVLAVVAAALIWRKVSFFRRSHTAQAKLASFTKRSAMEGNVWQSIVEFTDQQSVTHQLEYIGSGPYPPFAKVENLKVYFDPNNPKKAVAYGFWKAWGTEVAVSSFSLLLIWAGAVNLF